MVKKYLSSDCVYINHFNDDFFKSKIIDTLDQYKQQGKNNYKSNVNGFQSPGLDDSEIGKVILNWVIQTINENLKPKKNFVIEICDIWINENNTNSYNNVHSHPKCDFSGVYYLKVPENSGNIFFHNFNNEGSELNSYFHDSEFINHHEIKNYENQFLLFPSYLLHGVKPNLSKETRISVAFNVALHLDMK